MTYQTFLKLLMDVDEFNNYEMYLADVGGSISQEDHAFLAHIWTIGKKGIRGIREITGLSQVGFAKKYDIAKSTYESWEMKKDLKKDYRFHFMAYAVLMDTLESDEQKD